MNQAIAQGKIDLRRLEAARANRLQQLREWEEYDRKMRSLDKKKQQKKSYSDRRVIFENQYVLLDATLNNDLEEEKLHIEVLEANVTYRQDTNLGT
ncbi:unnamed protein product [Echinostoma caproni]|uniref:TPH domain-containing protein n=1 Tax=Echinostoma caproni TaxID=27848 RepID=A0A183BGB4_9TREM|nr:unnamed protein product [Echinostoma caproni]